MSYRGFMVVVLLLSASFMASGVVPAPLVQRGGERGGQETVSVQLGHGLVGVWDIRSGSLLSARIDTPDGDVSLSLEVSTPCWFLGRDDASKIPVAYSWRGYRIEEGRAVLMHELRTSAGQIRSVEERPEATVGVNGLLAMRSTFQSVDADDAPIRVIKRIRTGTPGGITMPVATSGDLVPLGLNDNFMADVVFREKGGTQITISFNAHWVEQSKDATVEEAGR